MRNFLDRTSRLWLEGSLVGARAVIQGGFQKLDVGDSSEIVFR